MISAHGFFKNFFSITNPFSLCVLRRSRNFSKAKSFYLLIPGPGCVWSQWFLHSPSIIPFPGRGMYGKGEFRTVFMSVVIPGWRFLDKLEQLTHISKLCLTCGGTKGMLCSQELLESGVLWVGPGFPLAKLVCCYVCIWPFCKLVLGFPCQKYFCWLSRSSCCQSGTEGVDCDRVIFCYL